ncbi:hypothetical protein EV379_0786 [Microterricola gilva]|uniref:Uncharacterized protein n=1 Tax=Microterricola gilva TaxID=393267 RepID=A0A4Q8AJ30_9MICO|nr:zf-HC2 domain-containing protein [Microterricola gilva]RZU64490.1 hypothetical protein EV379_0786 [Microterricola gilva]
MIDETDPYLDWDAAYTLGMLSAAERKEYERHLAHCALCSSGVTSLAGMPGILSMLSPAEALALGDATPALATEEQLRGAEHSPRPLPRASSGRALRPRSRLRMAALGGGAALLLVVGFGAFQLGSGLAQNTVVAGPAPSSAPTATGTPMQAADAAVMTAVLALESKPWGTRLDWQCEYVQTDWPGGAPTFELVMTDRAGTESVLARWTGAGEHAANLAASTDTPSSEISRVEIREVGRPDPLATAEL